MSSEMDRIPGYSYKLNDGNYAMDFATHDDLGVDESKMSAWIPFASGVRRDGVGDLLEISGIRFDRHIKNPVLLFDHGKGQHKWAGWPIALAEDPETNKYTVEIDQANQLAKVNAFFYQGKGMPGTDPEDESGFALYCEQLYDLWCRKFIRAGSIGYQVIRATQLPPDYNTGIPQGMHLLSVLMLEASMVVMPANMDTVRKSYDSAREILSLSRVCGKPLSPVLVKSLTPYIGEKKVQLGYEGRKGQGRNWRDEQYPQISNESPSLRGLPPRDPNKGRGWLRRQESTNQKGPDRVSESLQNDQTYENQATSVTGTVQPKKLQLSNEGSNNIKSLRQKYRKGKKTIGESTKKRQEASPESIPEVIPLTDATYIPPSHPPGMSRAGKVTKNPSSKLPTKTKGAGPNTANRKQSGRIEIPEKVREREFGPNHAEFIEDDVNATLPPNMRETGERVLHDQGRRVTTIGPKTPSKFNIKETDRRRGEIKPRRSANNQGRQGGRYITPKPYAEEVQQTTYPEPKEDAKSLIQKQTNNINKLVKMLETISNLSISWGN